MKKTIISIFVIAVLFTLNIAIAQNNEKPPKQIDLINEGTGKGETPPPGLLFSSGMEKKLGDISTCGEYGKVKVIFLELIEIIKEQDAFVEASGEYKDIQYYEEDGVGYASTKYAKPNGDIGYTVFITTTDGTIYLNFGPDADQSEIKY